MIDKKHISKLHFNLAYLILTIIPSVLAFVILKISFDFDVSKSNHWMGFGGLACGISYVAKLLLQKYFKKEDS